MIFSSLILHLWPPLWCETLSAPLISTWWLWLVWCHHLQVRSTRGRNISWSDGLSSTRPQRRGSMWTDLQIFAFLLFFSEVCVTEQEPVEVVLESGQDASQMSPWWGVSGVPSPEETLGQTQNLLLPSLWSSPESSPILLEEQVTRQRRGSSFPAETVAQQPGLG